jgi:hypothetical protein
MTTIVGEKAWVPRPLQSGSQRWSTEIRATSHVPLTSIMEVEANAFPKVHGNHALQDRGGAAQLTDYALYY